MVHGPEEAVAFRLWPPVAIGAPLLVGWLATLLYKARLERANDLRDLVVTWPLLAPEDRGWLRDAVRRLHPDHAWLAMMDAEWGAAR